MTKTIPNNNKIPLIDTVSNPNKDNPITTADIEAAEVNAAKSDNCPGV